MPESNRVSWPQQSRGLHLESSRSNTPLKALHDVTNMYYPAKGVLRSRGGVTTQYSPSGAGSVQVMYYWPKTGSLYWADNSGHLYEDGTEITGVQENVVDIEAFGLSDSAQKLYITEEKGSQDHTLHTYDGSSYSKLTGTSVPNVTHLMTRFTQLWGFGDADYPHRVYYSAYGDPTNWSDTWGESGHYDITPARGGDLKGWVEYEGNLFVIKEHATFVLSGQTDANFQVHHVGDMHNIQPDSIADVIQGVLFATDDGVYPLGRHYQGEPQNLALGVQGNITDDLSGSQAIYSQWLGAYLLCSGNSTVWVSNASVRPDIWTQFDMGSNSITAVYEADNLYFGTDDGKILKYDHTQTNDNGAAFDVGFKTGFWHLGSHEIQSELSWMEGRFDMQDSATVTIEMLQDDDENDVVYPGGWTIDADEMPAKKLSFECRSLALDVTYEDLTGPAYYSGVAFSVRPVRRTR